MKEMLTKTRIVSLAMTLVMLASCMGIFATNVSADYTYTGTVVYLSDNGNDSNDGKTPQTAKQTLAAAANIARKGTNGTVVITDIYSYNSHVSVGDITIAGLNEDSVFDFGLWGLGMNAPLTIKNLHINMSASWGFIMASGHRIEIGENVTITKNKDVTTYLSIRGGGDSKDISGNTKVVLKSGTFSHIYGGTRKANIYGNTFITIYDGVKIVGSVSTGNDGDGNIVSGAGVVKLVGKEQFDAKIIAPDYVAQGSYLDISEYSGRLDSLDTDGFSVCTDKDNLPEELFLQMNSTSTLTPATTQPIATKLEGTSIVFLSDNGNDANDGKTAQKPKKTLAGALNACTYGGMIVVVDEYTYSNYLEITKECTIAGLDSNSVLNFNVWGLATRAKLTVKNIHIHMLKASAFIISFANELIIDENVTVTKADGVSSYLSIRGGGNGKNEIFGDSRVVVKSGTFSAIHGGTSGANMYGNTQITIYDGVKASVVSAGNDDTNDFIVDGFGLIKLVGSNIDIGEIRNHKSVQNGCYIDVSEYTGEIKPSMKPDGAVIIGKGETLPEHINKVYHNIPDVYDLSSEKNLVYLSSKGNDENDGKTPETAVATIDTALKTLGSEGGTIAINGMFEYNKFLDARVPIKLTSTDSDSVLVWNLWGLYARAGITIENLNISVVRDYGFICHFGSPVFIGENVKCTLGEQARRYIGIRAGEKGDINSNVNITINSGTFESVYTGTKGGNINGDSYIEINGGKIATLVYGNDITNGTVEGGVAGNTTVKLTGDAVVSNTRNTNTNGGFCLLDVSEYEGELPNVAGEIIIKTEKTDSTLFILPNTSYISGYPDGSFKPNNNMKRSEAITVVSKIAGFSSAYSPKTETSFSDLKQTDWFYKNVMYLEEKEALGFFGGELCANEPITRGEFVELISGFGAASTGKETPRFTDVKAGDAHSEAIFAAASAGLINGYADGSFGVNKTITRAEIVTIISRLIQKRVVDRNASKITPFSDIDGHWARNTIVAAASERITNGLLVWYLGEEMPTKTAQELAKLDLGLTKSLLDGVEANNTNAVENKLDQMTKERIAEIRGTKTDVVVTGTSYYVSENGDDANDGKTPETAWKTLKKVSGASLAPGDGVFFKRGELFRGTLTTNEGVTYSAYGEGEKPRIYGSARNYSEDSFWDKTEAENVYVSKEEFTKDIGLIVFDEGKAWTIKKIVGVGGFSGELKSDLEMYHNTGDNKLYLYSVSDPNTRFKSTEIAVGQNLVSGNGNNVTIDNLCMKYTGAHCVGYGNGTHGLTVKNCELGWIGGMLQYGNVRFGNAVEIYVNAKDYVVNNCYIYEVYDAGVTHQYFQTQDGFVNMENIEYSNNVIEHCTYAIEYCNAQPSDKGNMKDIRIFGNILEGSGDGWGKQRPERTDAVIKGWSVVSRGENFVITDNIIVAGDNSMLIHIGVEKPSFLPIVAENVFIGTKGERFGYYGKNAPELLVYDETIADITAGLDNNTFIYR